MRTSKERRAQWSGMKIYFAGSIRGGRDDCAFYGQIVSALSEYGTVLTEHIGDGQLSGAGEDLTDIAVHERDLGWLKDSDCLVAEVTRPSLGVGYEIGKATEWDKPVLCLFRPGEGRSLSAMISGSNAVMVREYQTGEDLKRIIQELFS